MYNECNSLTPMDRQVDMPLKSIDNCIAYGDFVYEKKYIYQGNQNTVGHMLY